MKKKNRTHINMIRVTVIAFVSFFVGAGIFFTPKFSQSNTALTTTNSTNNSEAAPAEQARTLLRKVLLTGKCSSELAILDPNFEAKVGQACQITRDQMRTYLSQIHVNEWEVGGVLDLPVSSHTDANGNVTFAKYMVIHDTSYPRYSTSFPSNIDDETWEWNRLGRWVANVTHVYINRVGDSKTMTPLNEGMTATKYERYIMGDGNTKGKYLHIELIQPRKAMKGYGRHNDVDAPEPGFTDLQYKRLALLYTVASVRKGEWIIPAFHAAVDQGIKYCHDDPQNFDLDKFFKVLNELWADIDNSVKNTEKPNINGNGG